MNGPAGRLSGANMAALAVGFAFLLVPIAVLIAGSFNAAPLTGWGGFSTRWYTAIWLDGSMLRSVIVTVKIAALSATVAAGLGACLAVALDRSSRAPAGTLVSGLARAQLVMPEIVTGLSLLLLFVAIDLDRGFLTVVIAHITFSMCFVAVLVQMRLRRIDDTLLDVAADLGATPASAFVSLILPVLMPSILAGWLLAFALSLNDFVIALFTTGPGTTTLSMAIYAHIQNGPTPVINAICTLLIAVLTACVLLASALSKLGAGPDDH